MVLGLVLLAASPNIFIARSIDEFRRFVHDTGRGGYISHEAAWLLAGEPWFIGLAIALPVFAIGAVFLRGKKLPFIVVSVLFAVSVSQSVFTARSMASAVVGGLTIGR